MREAGFALAGVLFVLVLVTLITITSLLTTGDERVAGRAVRKSVGAFYAANAGLSAELAGWDRDAIDTLLTVQGDSVDLGWKPLENGDSYRAVLRLTGSGTPRLYSINVTGRSADPNGGQRELRLHLRDDPFDPICCSAAIAGGAGGVEAELDSLGLGGVTVSGLDLVPSGWASVCAGGLVDVPGIVWGDTTQVEVENDAVLLGAPPRVEDSSINITNLFDWGDLDYNDLIAMADITIPNNDINGGIGAQINGSQCDHTPWKNWGAPEDPSSPCFGYFPIIHAPGELRIRDGTGVGQGILLVDGELEIEDSFTFYGIVIVKGELEFEDNVTIYGGVIAGDELELEDGARVQYSQCAANRALVNSGLAVVKPLPTGAWEQVTN